MKLQEKGLKLRKKSSMIFQKKSMKDVIEEDTQAIVAMSKRVASGVISEEEFFSFVKDYLWDIAFQGSKNKD